MINNTLHGYTIDVTDVVNGYRGAGTFEDVNEEQAVESAKLYYADKFGTYDKIDIRINSIIKSY